MPVYEYRCRSCGHELEEVSRWQRAARALPRVQGRAPRVYGRVGVRFSGWGFRRTDDLVPGDRPRKDFKRLSEGGGDRRILSASGRGEPSEHPPVPVERAEEHHGAGRRHGHLETGARGGGEVLIDALLRQGDVVRPPVAGGGDGQLDLLPGRARDQRRGESKLPASTAICSDPVALEVPRSFAASPRSRSCWGPGRLDRPAASSPHPARATRRTATSVIDPDRMRAFAGRFCARPGAPAARSVEAGDRTGPALDEHPLAAMPRHLDFAEFSTRNSVPHSPHTK